MVGGAGAAWSLGGAVWRAPHTRSGFPRRRVTYEPLQANQFGRHAMRVGYPRHPRRSSRDADLRSAGLSVSGAGHRARWLRHASRVLRRRGDRRRGGLPAVRAVSSRAVPRLDPTRNSTCRRPGDLVTAPSTQNDHVVDQHPLLAIRSGGLSLDGLHTDPFPLAVVEFQRNDDLFGAGEFVVMGQLRRPRWWAGMVDDQ